MGGFASAAEADSLMSVEPQPSPSGEPPAQPPAGRPRGKLLTQLHRLYSSWATRSLAVGGIGAAIDIFILLVSLELFRVFGSTCDGGRCGWHTTVGAMIGVTFGSTFTFFANRHFAFRDHNPKLAPQAVKFLLTTLAAMAVHAPLVGLLTNRFHVNVVVAKILADILVFSVGQLLLLRYVVFPRRKEPKPPAKDEAPSYSGLR